MSATSAYGVQDCPVSVSPYAQPDWRMLQAEVLLVVPMSAAEYRKKIIDDARAELAKTQAMLNELKGQSRHENMLAEMNVLG